MTRRTAALLLTSALVVTAPAGAAVASANAVPSDPLIVSSSAAPAAAKAKNPDVTKLIDRARAKLRAKKKYAKAILLEADGNLSAARTVTRAKQVTSWRFVFDNQKTGNKFRIAIVTFTAGKGFGKIKAKTSPFLEDLRIHKTPKMKLRRAIVLLRRAGHTEGFRTVTLRHPLGPNTTAPLYIFALPSGDYIAVNTRTDKVSKIS